MGVFKPRTRIVSFRLSDEEYEALKTLCLAQGAHSVSEYARAMTCGVLNERPGPLNGKFESDLRTLRQIVSDLQEEMGRLTQIVEGSGSSLIAGPVTESASRT